MNRDGVADFDGVTTGQGDKHRDLRRQRRSDHQTVPRAQTFQGQRQAAQLVLAIRVGAGHVSHQLRPEVRQRGQVRRPQPLQILLIAGFIRQVNVDGGGRLEGGVVVQLVNGDGVDGGVALEDRGRAVGVVNVAIHHHRAINQAFALQAADGHRDVVDGAKALAMIGERVMEPATEVEADPVGERQPRRQQAASGGQPEGLHHAPRVRNLQPYDLLEAQRAGFQPAYPPGLVHQQHVFIPRRLGLDEVFRFHHPFLQQPLADQPVLLRGEDVVAEVQVVTGMVDQLEGQHQRSGGWLARSA